MNVLGLDAVLNLARQYGDDGEAVPEERRRGRGQGGRRPLGRRLQERNRRSQAQRAQRGARFAVKQKQLVLQSAAFKRSGQARTADHQMPDMDLGRQKVAGTGKWKSWTPEAVLRVGFGSETATYRQLAKEVEGASASQVRSARFVCASTVCKAQARSCQKVVEESKEEPLRFFIRNLMFDESTFQLKVGKDPATSCSVLCSHAQWSFAPLLADGCGVVRDEHIVRSPALLAPMNSATMWKTLSDHPGGLGTCDVAADHACTLTTCDAHSANLKMLKHMDSFLPADHLFLPLLCAQHRNGNVVEQLTHLLGNLGGCFCVSRVLNSRHAVRALRKRTGAALERDLVILPSEPAGVQDEWEQTRSQTRNFLQSATMFEAASKDSGDDVGAGDQGLAPGYATLLNFFNGPWTGRFCSGFVVCLRFCKQFPLAETL